MGLPIVSMIMSPSGPSFSVCPQVVVHLTEDLLSQAVMMVENSRPTLAINLSGARQYWLEGMLRHEIGQSRAGGTESCGVLGITSHVGTCLELMLWLLKGNKTEQHVAQPCSCGWGWAGDWSPSCHRAGRWLSSSVGFWSNHPGNNTLNWGHLSFSQLLTIGGREVGGQALQSLMGSNARTS